jgi:hypothetical protein
MRVSIEKAGWIGAAFGGVVTTLSGAEFVLITGPPESRKLGITVALFGALCGCVGTICGALISVTVASVTRAFQRSEPSSANSGRAQGPPSLGQQRSYAGLGAEESGMREPGAAIGVPWSTRLCRQCGLPSFSFSAVKVVVLVGLGWVTMQFLVTLGIRAHMKAVTQELARIEAENSQIGSDLGAFRAITTLGYVDRYCIPRNQYYRSDAQTEATLHAQHRHTTATIIQALQRYSDEQYGGDLAKWEDWREKRERRRLPNTPQPQGGSPPGGADPGRVVK